MIFSSMVFLWLFLPLVFLLNLLLTKVKGTAASNVLLFLASLGFYAWGEPVYIVLMLFSILINWMMGVFLDSSKDVKRRKAFLAAAVIIDLGLLCVFKYLGIISEAVTAVTGIRLGLPEISLPIGISFYTFQAMSYIVDLYRGDCQCQKSFLNLGLYISFFPQLIAGPILKYKDVDEQIRSRELTKDKVLKGARRFIYGLGKKVLIANVVAHSADKIFALDVSDVSGGMAWIASGLYFLQIYYDFSGYSDMAIGLGSLFGFEFKENFDHPYTSLSIRGFWKRWHISLGTWFREYVYIPLGGNRKGSSRTFLNLFIVFFLTGLWHGAGLSFICWGLYHGFFSILERIGLDKVLKRSKIAAWIYTVLVVDFGWVLFRLESFPAAIAYYKRMLAPWAYGLGSVRMFQVIDNKVMVIAILAFLGSGLIQRALKGRPIAERFKGSAAETVYLLIILVLCYASLTSNTYNPFIYYRF